MLMFASSWHQRSGVWVMGCDVGVWVPRVLRIAPVHTASGVHVSEQHRGLKMKHPVCKHTRGNSSGKGSSSGSHNLLMFSSSWHHAWVLEVGYTCRALRRWSCTSRMRDSRRSTSRRSSKPWMPFVSSRSAQAGQTRWTRWESQAHWPDPLTGRHELPGLAGDGKEHVCMRGHPKNTRVLVSSRPCPHKFPYICHGWRYAQHYPTTPPSAIKWLRKRCDRNDTRAWRARPSAPGSTQLWSHSTIAVVYLCSAPGVTYATADLIQQMSASQARTCFCFLFFCLRRESCAHLKVRHGGGSLQCLFCRTASPGATTRQPCLAPHALAPCKSVLFYKRCEVIKRTVRHSDKVQFH